MKRLYANRPNWQRITTRRFYSTHWNTSEYQGYVTLLCMDAITEPLWMKKSGKPACLVDVGYSWLQHFPDGAHYSLTTIINAQAQVVQWYIDVCLRLGVSDENIPWLDDLYLDIVVFPSGETHLLDADELNDALRSGEISQGEYEFAWQVSENLLAQIEQKKFPLIELCHSHRNEMLKTSPR